MAARSAGPGVHDTRHDPSHRTGAPRGEEISVPGSEDSTQVKVSKAMNTVSLKTEARENFGKGAARKLRAKGRVPALVYRHGESPRHISVDPHELTTIFRKSGDFNTLVALEQGGETQTCLLKATQKHPVTRELLHVDFYEVSADQKVVVDVALEPTGKALGQAMGGKVQRLARTVKVRCLPADIPAIFNIDVTPLDIGDMLQVTDVTVPSGCELVYDNVYHVVAITGRRDTGAAADDEDETAAEEAEA